MRDLETIYENMTADFYSSGQDSLELQNTKSIASHITTVESLIENIQDKRLRGQLRFEIKFVKDYLNDIINTKHSNV